MIFRQNTSLHVMSDLHSLSRNGQTGLLLYKNTARLCESYLEMLCRCRPDVTCVVGWALRINYLSIGPRSTGIGPGAASQGRSPNALISICCLCVYPRREAGEF